MASAVSQRIQQFVRSISEDIKLYQQLLPLLQQQKVLYLKFDGEALNDNVQKQMPILNKLSRSANDRSQCMRALGLACNDASVKRIFNALPAQIGMQARKQWALLETLVSQCQQYNQSNGHSSAAFHELVSQLKQPVQHTYEDKSF
ncbi:MULTISPECIES: flagellar export chaperone FlgN [Vibrio]|jgi:flagella synthesis protein FlgN|uniref:Flagellar protein FlgN n=3 Tax=Vibrio harveyi group TaxID=717610 RepID=A0A0H0YAW0_VIBAL|nr:MULTISPECIES: flagellar export chaperone FlgN [Vibrio]EEZ83942.1 LfgN [Vibrio alginolyticus 40B]MDG2627590.1 flagellar export chaperone FlgN [Vibrio parahaemolyticus]MDW1812351.1 flagellar export chaperone FlgN [Vibrio sp. Vb2362]MDW2257457.1 flagellar export chaperone FlgN [Vibrio sp. 1409]MDW2297626.1 flagellar export chaperone FlgN [Vibrio sp. 1404]QCO88533.1 flagellar protein FlgN [Vibrio neocaledonicus]QIR91341.1 flagellar protein FlgN [Vibrio diabolicus]GAJ70119.1 LfgN protein [Vib